MTIIKNIENRKGGNNIKDLQREMLTKGEIVFYLLKIWLIRRQKH